jgi:hypothetical protein
MMPSGNPGVTRAARLSLVLAVIVTISPCVAAQETYLELMRFATDMAKRGNWREAKFRWEKAAELAPGNAKVLNNLGVAHEVLGQPDDARVFYERAHGIAEGKSVIDTNRIRAERFWNQVRESGDGEVPAYDSRGAAPGDPEAFAKEKKMKGKSFKVTVELPVPARLDLTGKETLLVASFLTDESHLLDINRELVRFVRSKYRQRVDLNVLPVTPAPAVPEQTLDDLIANHEFWKYLGREYETDVIVSGIMAYDRHDSSGFRDVDVISPTTGQKVRQSQFVEQERFLYELDIIFMDGTTGELLFRDRLQRSALYRGTQNDPISAFFDLSESVAPDVLAIVAPRTREDIRYIFKK